MGVAKPPRQQWPIDYPAGRHEDCESGVSATHAETFAAFALFFKRLDRRGFGFRSGFLFRLLFGLLVGDVLGCQRDLYAN